MPNVRIIQINGSGGAFTPILASIACRQMTVIEDESVAPQGLIYQGYEDNFAANRQVGPSTEPLIFGNAVAQGGGVGPIIGFPAQNAANGTTAFNYIAATTILKVKSATVTATTIRVTEYD